MVRGNTVHGIRIDLAHLVEMIGSNLLDSLKISVAEGIYHAAHEIQAQWKAGIHNARHLSLEGKEEAEKSIRIGYIPGKLAIEVVSDHRYVDWVENGFPEQDLKRMLDSSLKVRRSTTGKPASLCPEGHESRHSTPARPQDRGGWSI